MEFFSETLKGARETRVLENETKIRRSVTAAKETKGQLWKYHRKADTSAS